MNLDQHSSVSTALALRLEGAAILSEQSTEEFLEGLLDKFAKKGRHSRMREQQKQELRETIREMHSQGLNDTVIANALGKKPQNIQWHRSQMGLPPVNPPGRPKKRARLKTDLRENEGSKHD